MPRIPIVHKEIHEAKTNDLDYTNSNFEYLAYKLDKNIPDMSRQVPRKSQLPG